MSPLVATFGGASARGFGRFLSLPGKARVITFTSTPVANFQVRVVLTPSNFSYSKAKSDGSDLRFFDETTSCSYWIETWNTSGTSIVWVKVPTQGASSVKMTYGYPDLTAMSDINATMEAALQFMYYAGGGGGPFASLDGGGIDPVVNYAWGGGTVSVNGFGSRSENVSIRWKGWVLPSASGNHTFYCITDDGSRVYVGSSSAASSSNMIINAWVDQGPTEYNGTVSITDGLPRFFQYEFFESGGGANAQIGWSTPNIGKTYPVASSYWRGPKYHSSYGDSFSYTGASVGPEASAGATPPTPKAIGGDVIANDGTYWYHAFLSTGTFSLSTTALTCDFLVIGGGGGGATSSGTGGGGGAGGLRLLTSQVLQPGAYTATVGPGGGPSSNGTNSSFNGFSASGGGRGGNSSSFAPTSGGSGGGGYRQLGAAGNSGGYSPVEGYAGGNGDGSGNWSAGGGGAGGVGGTGYNVNQSQSAASVGGGGGTGVYLPEWASASGVGQSGYFAGGGGGSGYNVTSPTVNYGGGAGGGGLGGGGNGGAGWSNGGISYPYDGGNNGSNGLANTGGGGGGAGSMQGTYTGGSGGSGLVVVRYPM